MGYFTGLPSTVLEAALWWAARGVPVFPCNPQTKKPRTKNGFLDASVDSELIRAWWSKVPDSLIGAPCGKASGLLVLDGDTPKKSETLTPREAIDNLGLGAVATVSTRSSGYHLYFRWRGERRRIRIAPQIDQLGEGGYVILPPSPGYIVVFDADLSELPAPTSRLDLNIAKASTGVDELIAQAHEPGMWWPSLVKATAHLHSRGTPHEVIVDLLSTQCTLNGYTPAQTRSEIAVMLRGCTEKVKSGEWDKPKANGGIRRVHFPDCTPKGVPRPSYANARVALQSFVALAGLEFSYERFADRAYFRPGEKLTDESVSAIRQLIIETYGFDPDDRHTRAAIKQLCWENSHDRVVDQLAAFQWDGVERIDRWLSDYLGADDTALNSAFGRKVLIAAVRRVRSPGCKFDTILLLQGPQGAGKSSVVRILAGEDALFSDQDVLHLDARAQQENTQGRWFYELSELAGLAKADLEKVKSYVSRTHDRARAAFGYFLEDVPRRCVFIATTNARTPLRDPTGNRRFWPVAVENVLLDALRRDRDQLLAEAAVAEARGESLMLPAELWSEAAQAQSARLEDDPWTGSLEHVRGVIVGDEERVAFATIVEILGIPKERQTRAIQHRVTEVMERLGWERGQNVMRVHGDIFRGYRRTVTFDDNSYEKSEYNE